MWFCKAKKLNKKKRYLLIALTKIAVQLSNRLTGLRRGTIFIFVYSKFMCQ